MGKEQTGREGKVGGGANHQRGKKEQFQGRKRGLTAFRGKRTKP